MTLGALLLWLSLLVLPGAATVRLLDRRRSWGETLAASAPVGIGLQYVVGLAATRTGLPAVRTTMVVVGALVLAWVVVECVSRWRREADATVPGSPPAALVMLVAAVLVGTSLWLVVHAPLSTPPGWDAMHHGFFVRQIADHETLDAAVVLSSDVRAADSTTSYYPLAMNLLAAAVHDLGQVRISTVLLASNVAFAGVVLPVSTFFLCRRLAPQAPLVAGFAALAAVVPGGLFLIEYTGRLTIVSGLALVPSVVLVLVAAWERMRPAGLGLGVLAVIGVAGVHTSEALVAGGTAALVVLPLAWARGAWRSLAAALGVLVAMGVAAALLLLVAEPGVRGLVGERSGSFGDATGPGDGLGAALEATLLPSSFPHGIAMTLWMVLAWLGCLTVARRGLRPLAGLVAAMVGFGVFLVLWLTGHPGPLAPLANVWYADAARMQLTLLTLGAVPLGCLLATVTDVLAGAWHRLQARRGRVYPRHAVRGRDAATTVVALSVFTLSAVLLAPPARDIGGFLEQTGAPVDADYRRAFTYVAEHIGPDGTLLDDLRNRGEMWAFVDDGVPVLFGNAPLIGDAPVSWREKLYLRYGLRSLDVDGCVGDLLRAFDVEYVVVGPRLMEAADPQIYTRVLKNRRDVFDPVFASGEVRVFSVEPPPPTPCVQTDLATRYPWDGLANAR